MIAEARAKSSRAVVAHTFVRLWPTASQPAQLRCSDGFDWVVKGRQSGKQAVTDQILGTLGRAMGGPIPEVGQVEVPAELIAAEPQLGHFLAGRAHGSRFQEGYTERESLAHSIPENRMRFAHLAAFYGLGNAQDHQFIYRVAPPPLVVSVDHGHFIGGGVWDRDSLIALPIEADLDTQIEGHVALSRTDLHSLQEGLHRLSDSTIASAVALPGDDWAITTDERVALAGVLSQRRDSLLKRLEERIS